MNNNTNKVNNPMKVITGPDTRWSYANVWEAKSINGGTPKFSVSLIIPKSDTKTVAKVKAAIEAAYHGFPGIKHGPYPFNFETIDGDYFVAHPGINKKGRFELFGDDGNYTYDRDDAATLHAFKLARQARFEHGETPHFADRRR